ncbi:CHC2 zinc finger domain-containing protein [Luteolibacter sp. AS25]|uniref:CHC2 zinc finger domain-containing protein n=1 Tax=Luteolibacter sp. AS25 TaxID=3135776 RepID=UPI00398AC25E
MKKPPFQVAPSKSRFDRRQQKVSTQDHERKLIQIKDSLPDLERYHGERITHRRGLSLTLHCPLHEDKTPSFTADARKGTWLFKCFSCGMGGSLIDLHAKISELDPRSFEAIKSSAQAVGIDLEHSLPLSQQERRKWAQHRQEAKRQALAKAEEEDEQKTLTAHQRKTLTKKLEAYLSKDWRADLWHSSPIWTDTPEESPSAFLNTLFPPEVILWMGEPYDTGQERHRKNFKCTSNWLKQASLPPRIAAGHFLTDSFHRSKDCLAASPFIIIESDDLIEKKPTNAGERDQNKALSYALARYCVKELGLHLRAVIDTGNKSLHLWFDRPPPKALAAIRILAPGFRIDTGLLNSCAAAPLRMPGCIHEKTQLPATLLYLDHTTS